MTGQGPYPAVVFAGGGNRCVWQAGFWRVAAPALGLRPRVVAGVSAGAYIACVLFSGRLEQAMAYAREAMGHNPRNYYPANLWRGGPLFPHLGIYRRGILKIFDQAAWERLRQGPQVRVLLARPPRWAGAVAGVLLGFGAYALEKRLRAPLHPRFAARLGFRPEVVLAADCAGPPELAELILASSCTPPIVPPMYRQGSVVLDGGLVDNVPLLAIRPGEGPTLVLLSRRYPPSLLTGHQGVTYIQPSRPVGISKWDYTNPQAIQEAFDLGRQDAESFLRQGPAALQR
ncbi:MAG: patatin-like phospholipase family protein [Desulfarculus sp.]|nr:patatin-like phospholipase family protein [Desulfarculus sp.]